MKTTTCVWIGLSIGLLISVCSVSRATTVTYTSKSDFLSAAGAEVQLESFEDGKPTEWQAAGNLRSGPENGKHATHGNNWLGWGSPTTSSPAGAVELRFAQYQDLSVTAVGFYVTDFGDTTQPAGYTGKLIISNNLGQSFVRATNPPKKSSGSEIFFGMISDVPFQTVRIDASTINDGMAYDEVYFVLVPDPVPEPGGLLLLTMGGIGLMATRWRKTSARG